VATKAGTENAKQFEVARGRRIRSVFGLGLQNKTPQNQNKARVGRFVVQLAYSSGFTMDPAKLQEMASKLTDEQRKELAEKMDMDLGKYMESMEASGDKYMDGWSADNWEQEMEQHPLFSKGYKEGEELSPLMQGMQDLKYSPDENTPEELAKNYKEDGNFNFKYGKYRGAIHQLLSIILKLRILVLLPVSTLPYVLKFEIYSLIGE
jgi:hypothetical protein